MTAVQREAQRQQLLLRTLWRDAPAEALNGWLRGPRGPREGSDALGLAAYRANAGAIAERALASAFPTVAALVGDDSLAALARDFWQQHPPLRGDLGEWGSALPGFIAASTTLASEPYLADSARLDWLVHRASRATDGSGDAPALDALAEYAPDTLRLTLRPGCAVLSSAWPVASLWQAHEQQGSDRFGAVRAAFAAGHSEHAFVRRDGYAARVDALAPDAAAFTRAVIDGAPLSAALDAAGEAFAFDHWLVQALQQRWLVAVQPLLPTASP